jgi:LEA14-like dessication related protein
MQILQARLVLRALIGIVAFVALLGASGCASIFNHDPIRVNVVGLEPMEGQGLEVRFGLKLRVQNPNESTVDFDGVALDLELNGKPFASGVSDQQGHIPRFGEAVVTVPVTVSAFAAARQALHLADTASLDNIPYVLRGKLGGALGGARFIDQGTLNLPGMR